MKENKYHYPSKEEIRVGWEGEINWNLGYEDTYIPITILYPDEEAKDGWNCNIDDVLSLAIWDGCAEIRCPVLSREQIEAEGWKYKGRSIDIWFEKEGSFNMTTWTSYKALMQYGLHDQKLRIYLEDFGNEHTIFEGKCPDINTFRTICKLVGV